MRLDINNYKDFEYAMNQKLLDDARAAGFDVYINGVVFDFGNYDIANELAKFSELQQPQWISVTEKLPNELQAIIAYRDADGWQVICYFFHNAFIIYDINTEKMIEAYGISHWMSTPSPPINTED